MASTRWFDKSIAIADSSVPSRRSVTNDLWLRLQDRKNPEHTCLTEPCVKHSLTSMVKTITKIGNSQGVMFDSALMDLAHLKPGDQVNVEVHQGGSITLTPLRPKPSRQKVSQIIKTTMSDYARTMKKLA